MLKLLADPWSSFVELLPEATSRGIGSTLCHPAEEDVLFGENGATLALLLQADAS